ncbi:MAG: ArnT family glycosyltransferase [Acidimicrobiia bacterium]
MTGAHDPAGSRDPARPHHLATGGVPRGAGGVPQWAGGVPRWAGAALAGLVALVGLAWFLASPVPPATGEAVETYQDVEPVPLSAADTVVQRLVARRDGLSRVDVRFGTYGGSTACTVEARLLDAGARRVLDERRIPCGDLANNRLHPVAGLDAGVVAAGQDLVLELGVAAGSTEPVAAWAGRPGDDQEPAVRAGGDLDVGVEAYTRYGDGGRRWDRLGLVLERMRQYRPAWGHPVVVVVLALGVVAGMVALVALRGRPRVAVLLSVVAAKGVVWSLLLPPLEAADEPAHVAYAQFVAEQHGIPRRDEQVEGLPAFSERLRAAMELTNQTASPPGDRPRFGSGSAGPDEAGPDGLSPRSGGGGNPAAGYAPPYYLGAAAAYAAAPGGFFDVLGAMRLWSVALGVLTAALVVGIGRRLFDADGPAIALALAVTSVPTWAQGAAAVNNDAAALATGALCTLVALDLALRPGGRWQPWLAGVALGAGLLAKPFLAAFGPVLLVAWLVGRLRAGGTGRRWAGDVVRAGAGVVATFGAWVALAALRGIPMVTVEDEGVLPGHRTVGTYLHVLTQRGYELIQLTWVQRLWATVSWTDTPISPRAMSALSWLTWAALALVGCWLVATAVDLVGRRVPVVGWEGAEAERLAKVVVCGTAVAATLALLHYIELSYYLRTGGLILSGRYALMVVPAGLAVLALAAGRFGGPRAERGVLVALVAVAAWVHLLAVGALLDRFYL